MNVRYCLFIILVFFYTNVLADVQESPTFRINNQKVEVIERHNGQKYLAGFWQDENGKGRYASGSPVSGRVQNVNGVSSNNTITAQVTQQVAKQSILKGVISNAAKFAKFGAKRNQYVLAASLLYQVFESLSDNERPYYSEEAGRFVKKNNRSESGTYACVSRRSFNFSECYEGHGSIFKLKSFDYTNIDTQFSSQNSAGSILCSDFSAFSASLPEQCQFKGIKFRMGSAYQGYGRCEYTYRCDDMAPADLDRGLHIAYVSFADDYFGDYLDVSIHDLHMANIQAEMDRNTKKWIEASLDDDGNIPDLDTTVSVADGTVAQSGAYTTPDGKVQQTRWDFSVDAGGNTIVKETNTPRPDLQPNSPEAPPLSGAGSSGTGASTHTPTGNNPSNSTNTNTGNNIGNNSNNSQQENNKPKEQDKDLCDKHPDILACDKQPAEVQEKELPEIPKETINLQFSPDNIFPNSGQCPEPISFEAMGGVYNISLEPACKSAEMLRPVIIAFAWLVAAFFVVKTVRSET